MTTVEITALGHQVKVDVPDGDLAAVVEAARDLWHATRTDTPTPGPATGFAAPAIPPAAGPPRRLEQGQPLPVRAHGNPDRRC